MAEPRKDSNQQPAKQEKLPAPDSVPKLPQTIFNLEKRGGAGTTRRARRP